MTLVRIRDSEDFAITIDIAELADVIAWERIGDEIHPYFVDDPATCAFPGDGRMEVEE